MGLDDNMFAMVSFLVIGLVTVIFALIWSNFASIDVLWSQTDVGSSIKTDVQSYVDNWDFILLCMYFGLHLMILGMAFLLKSHPVVYIGAILFTVLLVVIAAPISNNWEDIMDESAFDAVDSNFPMTDHIFEKLPFYEMIWAVLTMVILFGFARIEGIV